MLIKEKRDLNLLKSEYYTVTQRYNTRKLPKGDIRAFIGTKTWVYEKELLGNGENKYTAHIHAFESAIDDFKAACEKETFTSDLSKTIKLWNDSKDKVLNREKGGDPLYSPPVRDTRKWDKNGLNQVSLFSGAFGLDLGFMAAGFDHRVTLDIDKDSSETIKTNLPDVPFIEEDIEKVSTEQILDAAGLSIGEIDVLAGGPPCQPFSTAGKRQSLNDPRASPLKEFVRVIKEAQPRCFVMEEVEGLMSARLKHITIDERNKRPMEPDEEKGSAFKMILKMLESTGYKFTYALLNSADYGAPQIRRRLIFIGLREGTPELPKATHSNMHNVISDNNQIEPWNTFWESSIDLQGSNQEFANFSSKVNSYINLVPPGGYWRHLPQESIEKAMGGAYKSGGGKMGFYRRLAWDEPSPTVVTSPVQMATLFGHPEEQRPLSVEEYKRIQGFPDNWYLPKSASAKYKLIGNAVPVYLSTSIALKVKELLVNDG